MSSAATDAGSSLPTPAPGPLAALAGAWDLLRVDPIGLLVPTAGRLLVDVLTALWVRAAWGSTAIEIGGLVVLALVVRAMVGAPLRAVTLARAGRIRGFAAPRWGRPVAVLGTELVAAPLGAFLGVAVGLVGALAAAEILSEGWIATASVVLAAFTVAGVAAGVLVRAIFARAAMEVIVGGRSALGALGASARSGAVEVAVAFAVLLVGDVLTGLGALLCGALVLPGYPIADLAVAERWLGQRRNP